METSREAWGVGDGLRYRFTKWFLGKVSYEYAARLPRPDEMFGNGVLIQSNANLRPERSHNVNVGPRAEIKRTAYGDFVLDVNGFLRETSDQIVLLAGRQFIPYVNISDARGLGLENAFSWVAPERWLTLDGSFTWQDIRNTSTSGPFAGMNGMRIPSLPYLFASWGARGRIGGLPKKEDAIEPFYHGRFTHGFYRGWDIGDPEYKTSLPSQVNHDVGVTYSMARSFARFSCTFEVDNVTNARLYDFFGVQRPGRSFNLKLVGQL